VIVSPPTTKGTAPGVAPGTDAANAAKAEWSSHGITDMGKARKVNEDSFLQRADIGLWAVADGMGGYDAGDVASKMVVRSLAKLEREGEVNDYIETIERQLFETNAHLRQRAAETNRRMIGSTVTVLALHRPYGIFMWAGDSRLYRLRDEKLYQLTTDHSQVADYVSEGLITPDQALTHPMRNLITRAVGASEQLCLDIEMTALRAGDRYLLCSDGLTGYVTDAEIREVLLDGGDARETCERLIGAAIAHDTADNVTAVVVDLRQ